MVWHQSTETKVSKQKYLQSWLGSHLPITSCIGNECLLCSLSTHLPNSLENWFSCVINSATEVKHKCKTKQASHEHPRGTPGEPEVSPRGSIHLMWNSTLLTKQLTSLCLLSEPMIHSEMCPSTHGSEADVRVGKVPCGYAQQGTSSIQCLHLHMVVRALNFFLHPEFGTHQIPFPPTAKEKRCTKASPMPIWDRAQWKAKLGKDQWGHAESEVHTEPLKSGPFSLHRVKQFRSYAVTNYQSWDNLESCVSVWTPPTPLPWQQGWNQGHVYTKQ